MREKIRSLLATCRNRFLDKALDRALLDDTRVIRLLDRITSNEDRFLRMVDHIVAQHENFLTLTRYVLKSDEGFQKMMSCIGDCEVGTKNQANREEWIERTLKTVSEGSRILDVGAGELQYGRFCAHLRYVSQDFAQYDGIGDGSALQTEGWKQKDLDIVSDITAIPEPDGSFDAVMCIEVLEHVPDPILALREFSRLLRPGGTLVLTAPFCSLTHMAPFHMVTGFNRYFYSHHLRALGFDIKEMTPNGNYFEYMAQETRRIEYVSTRYAHDSPNRRELLSLKILLKMLDRFTRTNNRSEELLNFGYFIVAERI